MDPAARRATSSIVSRFGDVSADQDPSHTHSFSLQTPAMVSCCIVKSYCCGCSDVESGAKYIAVGGIVASIIGLASAFYPLNVLQVANDQSSNS